MSCGNTSEQFDDSGVGLLAIQLLEILKNKVTQYSSIISSEYLKMLVWSIDQTIVCLQVEPLTHTDVCRANRKLGLIREPLLQLRFEVVDSTDNVSKILTVFALHELYNTISKLLDTLHAFSHVEDQVNLDDLDFKEAISRHLREIFGIRDDT